MPEAVPSPPPADWPRWREALIDIDLPAGVIDLDALERNVDRIVAALDGTRCTLRPATKSIRCVDLLRAILDRGGDRMAGLMCFHARELVFLAEHGFDDLLLAYPSVRPGPLRDVARAVRAGTRACLVADSTAHLSAYSAAALSEDTVIDVILELDLSYRPLGGAVHLGARRSPLRTVESARTFARQVRDTPGLRLRGLMGYEAHVASTRERAPGSAAQAPVIRLLKRQLMVPALRDLRRSVVDALRADGHTLDLINGGGTGSLPTTPHESTCTEVTAGSGFLCSHLFDGFDGVSVEPALFLAFEVVRRPSPDIITCLGGGVVASGAAGPDRLPVPWLPRGLSMLAMEGAGEVQTPLRGPAATMLQPGDPVLFRPAKAGEPAERFRHYHLVRNGAVERTVPTYRGARQCFL